jgi:hypothetical protein
MNERKTVSTSGIDPKAVLAAVDAYRPPHILDPLVEIRPALVDRVQRKAITLAALAKVLGQELGKTINPKKLKMWLEEQK